MQPRNVVSRIKIEGLFDSQLIDWKIPKEQSVSVLVGRNGTGKSTILNIVRDVLTKSNSADPDLYEKVILTTADHDEISLHSKSKLELGLKKLRSLAKLDSTGEMEKNLTKLVSMTMKIMQSKAVDSLDVQATPEDNDVSLAMLDEVFGRVIEENRERDIQKVQIGVTYISTIDMLANSIREFKDSSGIKINYLNQEINSNINVICKSKNKLIVQILEKTLNSFFEESCKKVLISDDDILVTTEGGKKLSLDRLSSGEMQLIYIFVKVVIAAIKKHQLVLMDEPEISLHMSWQKKLLSSLREINNVSQMIIVTHSPALVLREWRDSYIDIRDISSNDQ